MVWLGFRRSKSKAWRVSCGGGSYQECRNTGCASIVVDVGSETMCCSQAFRKDFGWCFDAQRINQRRTNQSRAPGAEVS